MLETEDGFDKEEVDEVEVPVKVRRKLTDEDILKYEPMVEKYIRDSVVSGYAGDVVEVPVKVRRKLTDEDILKYEPMVEKYIRDSVVKNWNEASTSKARGDIALCNSGMTVNDIRQ